MAALEVELYLTHLAVGEKVSANTQKQALNALVFLYHRVLQKPLGRFRDRTGEAAPASPPGVKQGGGRADFARHEWNPSLGRNAFVRDGNAVTGMPALAGSPHEISSNAQTLCLCVAFVSGPAILCRPYQRFSRAAANA